MDVYVWPCQVRAHALSLLVAILPLIFNVINELSQPTNFSSLKKVRKKPRKKVQALLIPLDADSGLIRKYRFRRVSLGGFIKSDEVEDSLKCCFY